MNKSLNKTSGGLVIGLCCVLLTAGMVGEGGYRLALLGVAALIAAALAARALGLGKR